MYWSESDEHTQCVQRAAAAAVAVKFMLHPEERRFFVHINIDYQWRDVDDGDVDNDENDDVFFSYTA